MGRHSMLIQYLQSLGRVTGSLQSFIKTYAVKEEKFGEQGEGREGLMNQLLLLLSGSLESYRILLSI